jgi:hypothetical protein
MTSRPEANNERPTTTAAATKTQQWLNKKKKIQISRDQRHHCKQHRKRKENVNMKRGAVPMRAIASAFGRRRHARWARRK